MMFDCSNHTGWHARFVESAVRMRLFLDSFIVRDGCRYVTPLFIAIEDLLVQPFLLLSDQSFLEGHLSATGMSITQLLVFVESVLVLSQLHIVLLNHPIPFNFFLLQPPLQISLVLTSVVS